MSGGDGLNADALPTLRGERVAAGEAVAINAEIGFLRSKIIDKNFRSERLVSLCVGNGALQNDDRLWCNGRDPAA